MFLRVSVPVPVEYRGARRPPQDGPRSPDRVAPVTGPAEGPVTPLRSGRP